MKKKGEQIVESGEGEKESNEKGEAEEKWSENVCNFMLNDFL